MKSARMLLLAATSAFLGVACGPPPPAQSDPAPQPAGTDAVVVVPPAPTSSATPEDGPPDAPKAIPSRPASTAGNLDECIARLRDTAGSPDPAKMVGESDYRNGLNSERSGSLDRARRSYFNLIQNYPQSAFVPAAYFAFGELFLAEFASDPSKGALAEQSYREVIKYPAPENTLNAVSHYRLGMVQSKSQPQRALASFSRAAKADQGTPKDGCAAEVAAAALTATVPLYVDLGEPAKCWSFYLTLTADGERAARTTLELAEHYVSLKKAPEAATCLAASLPSGAAAQKSDQARTAYCTHAKAVAAGVRAGSSAPAGTLDKQISAACP